MTLLFPVREKRTETTKRGHERDQGETAKRFMM